ncbi:MAG: hypothetical protein PHU46_05310 [Rhodocyclaceae bacterium]|nr:hypothetical protein [Rhodocyclaceae bacterium]
MRAVVTKLLMLFAVLCGLAAPAYGDNWGGGTQVVSPTACSSYMGKATLNELRIGASGSTSTSNQIEIYNSGSVAQSVWQTWQLVIYYRSGGGTISQKGGYYLSSGFTANGQFIYNSSKSLYMRNKNGRYLDVALVDSSGKLIDYVAMDGTIQSTPSCFGNASSKVVNATATDDMTGDVARMPDGGSWPANVNNSTAYTIGRTNLCSSGGSDLVVNNSVSSSSPIVNTTQVTYTVTVLNKSCTNSVSGVVITDTGIVAGKFTGLTYSPSFGSTSQGASALVWNVGTLSAGNSATLTITGTPNTLGALNTTAAVTSPAAGSLINTGDDSAAANMTVKDFNYVDFDLTTDTVAEGEMASYSASISAGIVPSQPVTINYTVSGTAGSGDTNLPTSGSVVLDPNSADSPMQTSIDFNVTNDNIVEPLKTIVLTITSVTSSDPAVKLGPSNPLTITLLDDDATSVAQYALDESFWTGATGEVKDSSGNNFNGKAVGTGGLPTTDATAPAIPGTPGTCGYGVFAGGTSPQSVSIGTVNLGLSNAVAFSVAAWVQWGITPASGNQWANIVSNVASNNVNDGQFWLQHSQLNDRFEFALKSTVTRSYVQSKTAPVVGQWYHVVGVFDGAALHIYVNGNLDDNSVVGLSGTVTPFLSNYGLSIGSTSLNTRGFQGNIDEVTLYKGALTPSQIADLYQNSHACPTRVSPAPAALNAVDTGGNAVSGKILTKTAGSGFSLDVYALNAGKTAQDTSYSGSVLVDLLANTVTGVGRDAQNCPTSSTVLSVGTVTLAAGKGTVTIPALPDAWRDVRPRMRYPATGTATVTACATDNFAVKPASLSVQAGDTDWASAGTARVLNATGATGTPFHKAGRPFSVTVSGYNSAGVLTGNYNGSPIAASLTALSPATLPGTFLPGSFSGSGGTVLSSTASYNDVGSFSVQFQDTAFASVDAGDTAASCAGYYVCSGTVTIGRFVPDHFVASGASATPACGGFTYFGQDGLGTSFTLTAQDANNNTTLNYAGTLARLDLTSYARLGFTATGVPTGVTWGSGATAPSGTWSGGIATNVGANHLFVRPTSAITNANIALFAAPSDLDGVTVASATALGSTTEFRYGRVHMMNTYGSELLDLPVSLKSEYWNGTGWVFNGSDNCTGTTISIAAAGKSDITAKTCVQDGLGASGRACTGTPPAAKQFKEAGVSGFAGDFNLWLKAPGIPGSVDVTATVPAWLQYNWSGSVANPKGRATFGVFKAGPVIYMREYF